VWVFTHMQCVGVSVVVGAAMGMRVGMGVWITISKYSPTHPQREIMSFIGKPRGRLIVISSTHTHIGCGCGCGRGRGRGRGHG